MFHPLVILIYSVGIFYIWQYCNFLCDASPTETEQNQNEKDRDWLKNPIFTFNHERNAEINQSLSIFLSNKERSKEYEDDAYKRPPYTYPRLIYQALMDAPDHKCRLVGIFKFIETKYAFYRSNSSSHIPWRRTIRYSLSNPMYRCYLVHIKPDQDDLKNYGVGRKPGIWTIDTQHIDYILEQAYKVRKKGLKYI